MLRKKKLLLIIIPGLIFINLLQWLPFTEQESADDIQLHPKQININEFRVSGFEVNDKYIHNVRRDLFFTKKAEVITTVLKNEVAEPPGKKITVDNGSLSIKNNQDIPSLKKIRLEAVLFNNGEKSAYLVIGDDTYAIKKGDIVEKLYLIEDVSVSTVTLTDIKTHKSSIVSMQ